MTSGTTDSTARLWFKWTVFFMTLGLSAACFTTQPTGGPRVQDGDGAVIARSTHIDVVQRVVGRTIVVSSVATYTVNERAVLISVKPLGIDEGLTVLGARISYLHRSRDGFKIGGYPGDFCADEWIPDKPQPTDPVEGLAVWPGDRVVATLLFRADQPGDFAASGAELVYELMDGRRERVSSGQWDLKVVSRRRPEDLPGPKTCNPRLPRFWLGEDAPEDAKHFLVSSPSPSP